MSSATAVVPALSFTAAAQTCDPSSPCLYTGSAKTVGGSSVSISVKMDVHGNYVAEVNGKGTFYVLVSQTDEEKSRGSYYINVGGNKYYFSM